MLFCRQLGKEVVSGLQYLIFANVKPYQGWACSLNGPRLRIFS